MPGIGQKTATKLIQDYGTLENILEHVDELPPRARTSLIENREQAIQSKHLATIVTDVPMTLDLEGARALRYDPDHARRVFYELEFYSLADRLPPPARRTRRTRRGACARPKPALSRPKDRRSKLTDDAMLGN